MSSDSLTRRTFLGACAAAVPALTAAKARGDSKARKLLMIAGTPSHGPGAHEFNAGTSLLHKFLGKVDGLQTVLNLNGWPKDDSVFDGIDAIFLFCDGGNGHPFIQRGRLDKIGELMKQGVGLMCAHFAVEVPKDKGSTEFREWIGGHYEHEWSCNPMWKPEFTEFPDHPISRGVKPFSVRDEWYFNMRFREGMKGVTPILSAKPSDPVCDGPYVYPRGPYKHIQEAKGRAEAMMWAMEREDGGRGVGFTGGHFHSNWSDPNFRKVALNALLWISKVEVPRGGVGSAVSDAEMKQNLDPKK